MSAPKPSTTADKPARRQRAPVRHFPCRGCGAQVEYDPVDDMLTCPHCNQQNELPKNERQIKENSYKQRLRRMRHEAPAATQQEVDCDGCGAHVKPPENVSAFRCPFCDSSIVAQPTSAERIQPEAVLPFGIDDNEALKEFREWVNGLWFAPTALKRAARIDDGIRGVYMPYWTYDCNAVTFYRGERGEHRFEKEEYYETDAEGNQVKKKREKQITKWFRCSGTVSNGFNDVLVVASESLPRKQTAALEPWDLEKLKPYAPQYLSGFEAESYAIDLVDGFEHAKDIMDSGIRQKVKHDIGGDEQRIHTLTTEYNNISYKYILLPLWLAAYRYQGKPYRFMVNGRTGEVQGERPYSLIKIALAVLGAGVAFVLLLWLLIAVAV